MSKVWNETVAAHRREVREAILDAAARLVSERGALSVTMSEIAEQAAIGRATLYKYFPDVEAILVAWPERHVSAHLELIAAIAERPGGPGERLAAVLEAYALVVHERGRSDMAALLHRDEHAAHAGQHLQSLLVRLLAEGRRSAELRSDIGPEELANFCLHALAGASALPSKAAVHRLVAVTIAGLRHEDAPGRQAT